MTRPTWIGIALVIAGAAIAGWRASVSTSRTSPVATTTPPVEGAPPHCAFAVGERLAFAISATAEAKGTDAAVPSDQFRSILSWEVVSAAPQGGWLLRAALSSVVLDQHLTPPPQRVLDRIDDTTFMLRIDPPCRFAEKGFAKAWQPVTRRFVTGILSSLEIATPPEAGSLRWDAEQSDGIGPYRAHYEAVRNDDGSFDLVRTKDLYHEDPRGKGLGIQLQLLDAKANAKLDAGGRWLRDARGEEHVKITVQGRLVADLVQHFTLARSDASFVRPPADVDEAVIDWRAPSAFSEPAEADVSAALRAVSFDDAVARFQRAYRTSANGDAYGAARELAEWLRARPDQASVLVEAIRRGKIPEAMRPAAFLALERCGTDEARKALSDAVSDPSLAEMDRARAASALSDVPRPTLASARALADSSNDAKSKLVAGTSVRALGHLTSRTASSDAEIHGELHDALRTDLDHAPDDSRLVDVLDAVGNSGDARFVPTLQQKLTDASPAIREHAAKAMRSMPLADVHDALIQSLQNEPEADVRAAIVESLQTLGDRDPADLGIGARVMAAEATPKVRASLIRWLGAAVDVGVAKEALVAQFRRERVPALLQLIGHYVSAPDLR